MRIPFNILDESFALIDDPIQPLTVQIEARVAGRLDENRLRAALSAAAAVHPMARARVLPARDRDPHPYWQVDEGLQVDALQVLDAQDDETLDTIRGDLLSTPLSLFESPPWRARLVHVPNGDVLMMSVHHAASDGVGCLRLLQSVLRAYGAADDPTPDIDPIESHSLAFAGNPNGLQRRRALTLEIRKLRHALSPPARVAPDGAADVAGYGIVTRRVPADLIIGAPLRHRLGASVNDVLLATLHLAVDRWNTEHDRPAGRIAIHMPINARPGDHKHDIVGNLVTGETVSTTPEQRTSTSTCLGAVAGWTASIKDRGPQPAVAFLAALPNFNVSLKRNVITSAMSLSDRGGDSSVLSNVGRIAPDWIGADDLVVQEVLFSPPTFMPLGVGVGAAATDQWLSLSFRHRPALMDRHGAVAFSDLFIEILTDTSRAD